jgi:hypothetical protein
MRTAFAVLLCMLWGGVICAQEYPPPKEFKIGSVVIFNRRKDSLVVAADSREVHPGTSKAPDDTYCKIEILGSQVVFTSVGIPGAEGSGTFTAAGWDNRDVARDLVRSAQSTHLTLRLHDIVVAWADSIMRNWRVTYRIEPTEVASAAQRNDGQLTAGIFARAEKRRNPPGSRRHHV